MTARDVPSEVEQLRSKVRYQVVRRTGEVLVTFTNETSFLPGTLISEAGTAGAGEQLRQCP